MSALSELRAAARSHPHWMGLGWVGLCGSLAAIAVILGDTI